MLTVSMTIDESLVEKHYDSIESYVDTLVEWSQDNDSNCRCDVVENDNMIVINHYVYDYDYVDSVVHVIIKNQGLDYNYLSTQLKQFFGLIRVII